MFRKSSKSTCCLLGLLFCLFNCTALAEGEGLDVIHLRRSELMKTKPDAEKNGVRIWTMRRDERSRTALVELKGDLPLHMHPDARHTILVLEGYIWFRRGVAKSETLLRPGDFVSIGAGVPHKYRVAYDKALIMSFDAPAYDPKKTVKLD